MRGVPPEQAVSWAEPSMDSVDLTRSPELTVRHPLARPGVVRRLWPLLRVGVPRRALAGLPKGLLWGLSLGSSEVGHSGTVSCQLYGLDLAEAGRWWKVSIWGLRLGQEEGACGVGAW